MEALEAWFWCFGVPSTRTWMYLPSQKSYKKTRTDTSDLTLRNSAPKKRDKCPLSSHMFLDLNCMGIPVKKRDMNAIHPLS